MAALGLLEEACLVDAQALLRDVIKCVVDCLFHGLRQLRREGSVLGHGDPSL